MRLSTEVRPRRIGARLVGEGSGLRSSAGRGVWPRGHPCGIMKDNEVSPRGPAVHGEIGPRAERRANRGRRDPLKPFGLVPRSPGTRLACGGKSRPLE